MNANQQTGLYGKLPAYGDFVSRNLNSTFVDMWDEWLQHFIYSTQEELGNDWLDIYLTSPIWRFCLSPGVIDNRVWAGVMMPSVDRVGRYFPISIIRDVGQNISPVAVLLHEQNWFQTVEQLCLDALDESIDVDVLITKISDTPFSHQQKYTPTSHLGEDGPVLLPCPATDQDALYQVLPYFLDASLNRGYSSFSLWQTTGSEHVDPLVFSCQGLPPIGTVAAMLDGQWQQRNWKYPYNLKLV